MFGFEKTIIWKGGEDTLLLYKYDFMYPAFYEDNRRYKTKKLLGRKYNDNIYRHG
jgi:hypothetical protein